MIGPEVASLSKLIVILSTGFSATLLFFTLRRAGKEIRVRPGLEWARVGVGLGGIVLMSVIVGARTPPGLAVGAVVVGGIIGVLQGQQMTVTIRDDHAWAQRTMWGILLFSAGLITMQLAGLGTRTGAFNVGRVISLFSVAVGMGIVLGRPQPTTASPPAARPTP